MLEQVALEMASTAALVGNLSDAKWVLQRAIEILEFTYRDSSAEVVLLRPPPLKAVPSED